MFSSNAVGRISSAGNAANAITARKPVLPACPTVEYRRDTAPKAKASMSTKPRCGTFARDQ
jgi:hypothetical protein